MEQILRAMDCMHIFQTKYNIKDMCITNTQSLYDIIKTNAPSVSVQAKAVVCVYINGLGTIVLHIHLVVVADGNILDPSVEVFRVPNKEYLFDIEMAFERYASLETEKQVLREKMKGFEKRADEINNGGIVINDKEYYNRQFDFLQENVC